MKKFIIILGCNFKQLPYLINLKKKYSIILIDKKNNAPGSKFADLVFQCSYTDIAGLNKIYKKIKKYNIYKIFTASSHYAHVGASFFAKKFNVSYPSKKNINICINKALYYAFFTKNNLKIPKTHYLKNKYELKKILLSKNKKKTYFIKSDFSKNPNYIYKGTPKELLKIKINWKKDQFFKKKYILQEKFFGKNLRVNIYNNKYNIYDFYSGNKIGKKKYLQFIKLNIIKKLKKICKKLGMYKWLLKFDIILSKNDYVLLDVGMDPPHRMRVDWEKNKKNFINFYLNLYLK